VYKVNEMTGKEFPDEVWAHT